MKDKTALNTLSVPSPDPKDYEALLENGSEEQSSTPQSNSVKSLGVNQSVSLLCHFPNRKNNDWNRKQTTGLGAFICLVVTYLGETISLTSASSFTGLYMKNNSYSNISCVD